MSTDWNTWFHYQLKASADGLEWAFSQIPTRLHHKLLPDPEYFGAWQPARHVWHITEYERCLALPAMRQWLGGPLPPADAREDEDAAWAKVQARDFFSLTAAFRAVRQEQIDLLDQFTPADWTTSIQTGWGPRPLSMVVTKTFQHTYEHADTLLRTVIWLSHLDLP